MSWQFINGRPVIGSRRGSSGLNGAPSNLVLTVLAYDIIRLDYASGSTNQDGYRIYISSDGGVNYIEKGTSVIVTFNATSLTENTEYYFYVVAYKGGTESSRSNIVHATTFIYVPDTSPDTWLKASEITQEDLTDITAWNDTLGNNNFLPKGSDNYATFRKFYNEFVQMKGSHTALRAIVDGAGEVSLSTFEAYLVFFPSYSASGTAKMLMAYRDRTQDLLQLSMSTVGVATCQFRTSTGSIQTITNDFHVRRYNIIHLIFDKPNNRVTFEIDGVDAHLDYTFNAEVLRSTILCLFNFYQSTTGADGAVYPLNFTCMEAIFAFTTNLSTVRANIYSYLNTKFNLNNGLYASNVTLAQIAAATPQVSDYIVRQDIYDLVTATTIDLVEVNVGDDPQAKFDAAVPGSLLRFKAGTHTLSPNKNRSLLYVDKPMYIELETNAILKLADNSNTLDHVGELVTNQGVTAMTLNDLSFRGTYSGTTAKDLCIKIDGAGTPDTFKWGIGDWEPAYTTTLVAMTGDWQALGTTGIEIKFNATTGHAVNNLWIIPFDGQESYGIRVGTGTHLDYIHDVVIFGDGIIDMNDANQIKSSVHATNLPSGILLHGQVIDPIVEGITVQNGHRSIMVYGDNDGTYGTGGTVVGGTSYNVINPIIVNTTTSNDFSTGSQGYGILLGHPGHRGMIYGAVCNLNTIASYGTGIEPNLRNVNFEIRNNYSRCSSDANVDIHVWRESINGLILNNNATDPANGNAPAGWQTAKNIYKTGNVRA